MPIPFLARCLAVMTGLVLGGCSHDGHLVTTEKDAWISVESGNRVSLFYCSAEDKEHPICFLPSYVSRAAGTVYRPIESNPRFQAPLDASP